MKLEHHLDHFTLGLVFHKCPLAVKTLIHLYIADDFFNVKEKIARKKRSLGRKNVVFTFISKSRILPKLLT